MIVSPAQLLKIVESVSAMTFATSAAQILVQRDMLRDGGLASRTAASFPAQRILRARALRGLFSYPVTVSLTVAKLSCAVAVVASSLFGFANLVPLTALVLLAGLWCLRAGALTDGAERFSLLCLIPSVAAGWIGTENATAIALSFIAAQGSLVYATAGISKLTRRQWWNGQAMLDTLSSASFGSAWPAVILRNSTGMAKFAGLAIAVSECGLAVAAIAHPIVCIAILAGGVSLHFAIARYLGLNTYLYAFPATYPAVFFVSCRLHR